jgi:ribosomal protein S18 acetylase RimI-like enzyme
MKKCRIRYAGLNDRDRLVDFQKQMARETEGRELDKEVVKKGVEAVLKDERKGFYVLAVRDGQILASLMVTTEWSDWRNGFFWWIQSVYVIPASRRRGIFSLLYNFVDKQARETEGVCGLRLYVEKENRPARDTYRALGMRETGYRLFESEF